MSTAVEQFVLSSQISDHPLEVKTHFLMLEVPNKQGQARYRCLTCNHEFRCTGKIRLIQHVTGESGSRVKHVKACPSPFLPLKENLIRREQAENKIITSQKLNQLKRSLLESEESIVERTEDKDDEEESVPEIPSEPVPSTHDQDEPIIVGSYVHPMRSSSSGDSAPSTTQLNLNRPCNKESINKPKGKKRSYPSSPSTYPSCPSKKFSQPPTGYLISNERLMSLIRRMHSIAPEIVQNAIVLESMEDVKGKTDDEPVSNLFATSVPSWVSTLFSSFITSPLYPNVAGMEMAQFPSQGKNPSTSIADDSNGIVPTTSTFPESFLLNDSKSAMTFNGCENFSLLQLAHLMQYSQSTYFPVPSGNGLESVLSEPPLSFETFLSLMAMSQINPQSNHNI